MSEHENDQPPVAKEGQYRIRLENFEGPLDLLLYLIKKNDVDIYDIPIALITQQYLEYIDVMKQLNLDMVGEFLVMAAELIHIKSRMLLPTPPPDQTEEEQGPDPRAELVKRLLEYQQFKEAADSLRDRNLLGRDTFIRGGQPSQWVGLEEGVGYEPVSIFALVEAFRKILAGASDEIVHEVIVDRISVRQRIMEIMDSIKGKESFAFEELFDKSAPRGRLIITFLAVLELVRIAVLKIHQDENFQALRLFQNIQEEPEGGDLEVKIKDDYL